MTYSPSNWVIERLRGMFKRRVRDAELAYLGDTHGAGARVDVPGKPGFVYVHFPNGKDENGFALYSPPQMARSGSVAYLNYPGAGVYVAIGYDGDLEIKAAQYKVLDQVGINTTTLNPLNQQSKFVYPWQLTYGMANAVANSVTASTLVTVKKLRHFVGNLLTAFDTPLAADKIDLAAYIPASDTHCYAAVWIDTYTNLPVVTTSVAQAMTTPLDATDLQELVVRAASSRPADGIPLKAFYLSNAQTTITQSSLDVDLRQFLDNPVPWGFPTTLTTLERVRPGYTLVTGPYTASGVGALTIEALGKVIIVHKSNVTNTAPGVGDDSGDGYSIGSQWFDTSTDTLYIASDVTVGAAVWDAVTGGGGGMTSFDVIGDTGDTAVIVDSTLLDFEGAGGIVVDVDNATKKVTIDGGGYAYIWSVDADNLDVQPVFNGGLVNLIGGTGIETAIVSGPDVTITLSNTSVVADTYAYPSQIIVNAQGQIEDITAGSAPGTMSSFNVSGDTGTPQAIAEADTLNIAGGAGIDTVASGTDVLTVAVDSTVIRTTGPQSIGTGLTIDTPTISNYTNAQHDHLDADDGGTLTPAIFGTQTANTVLSGPTSGGAANPTFRALGLADVPNLIAIIRDEKTTGTAGGTSTSTTWNARDLNTESYDPGAIVSISSNQFTPIAGDYEIWVAAPFRGGTAAQSNGRVRLYNVTGAAAVEEGMSVIAVTNTFAVATLQCKFTANGTDAFRVDSYTSTGVAATGLGAAVSDGSAEVYTTVYLRKVA